MSATVAWTYNSGVGTTGAPGAGSPPSYSGESLTYLLYIVLSNNYECIRMSGLSKIV